MVELFEFGDEERDEDAEESKDYADLKQYTVWLIDARGPMLVEANATDQGFESTDSWLAIAIKIVKAHLKSYIISSSADQAAIILYGTGQKSEDSQFSHVYVLQNMDEGSARRLRELDQVLGGKFDADIGSAADGSAVEDLSDGLWAAFHQLARAQSKALKKVYIMTNDPGPADDEAEHDQQRAISKGTELKDAGAMLELLPMVPTGGQYQPRTFWAQLLELDAGTVVNIEAPETDAGDGGGGKIQRGQLSAWAEVSRFKMFKKRTLRMTNLTLGGFSIGVQLYKMVAKAKKGKTFQLHATTNDELITESALIDQDTGHVLTKPMLNKVTFPKDAKSRFPRVYFSREEMEDLKKIGPVGIHILGFKPTSQLRPYHNLREPTFIYPTDRSLQGSTTAFIALHDAMLQEDCFAVACALARGDPALVALLPQVEVIAEEDGGVPYQFVPPGFQMITLPFSDDIRLPEREPGFTGTEHSMADDAQIAVAEQLIDALQLPEDFDSAAISNPTLQRFYEVLESRALSEDTPSIPPDQTLPDAKRLAAASDVLQTFAEATFNPELDPKPKSMAAPKRKADSSAQAADVAEVDWAGLKTTGQLAQKTIPELKAYCEAYSLEKSGTKAVLLERVEDHIAGKQQ